MWSPLSSDEMSAKIAASTVQMAASERRLWELVRVPPTKWSLPTWGDEGGGFWVVGLIGQQTIWYNDIEEGFNVSPYTTAGTISEYACDQDELHRTIWLLRQQLESGTVPGRFGPPQPLPSDSTPAA